MPKWLPEEEELFKECWESGEYSPDELGEIFQRNADTVRQKAQGMGLKTHSEVMAITRLKLIKSTLKEHRI